VSRMFHYMMTQVVPKGHLFHHGLEWACRDVSYGVIVGSSARYLMQRVFWGILELTLAGLTLAVRDMRWHLSMTLISNHTT
jgi:hypothetical protein